MKMNENDLINNYSKKELEELLKIQIEQENYEGAKIVKSAIDQYDECYLIEFIQDNEIDENEIDENEIDENNNKK